MHSKKSTTSCSMPEKPRQRSEPVKATWFRTHLTRLAVSTLARLRPRVSAVLFLTPGICVKYGKFQHLSSAATMRFVATNTSMPVPKIYCAFKRKDITYIVMSRIKGDPLGDGWEQRSDESKQLLMKQLKSYLEQLRSIQPAEPGAVQGIDGGKIYDVRLHGGVDGIGPFTTVRDFHTFLREGAEKSDDHIPEIRELIDLHDRSQYTTCFTHGDLNSRNILVHGEKLVGVVDWDTAGWYPEYWEYTSASEIGPYNAFCKADVDMVLGEYRDATRMEQLRRKFFAAI